MMIMTVSSISIDRPLTYGIYYLAAPPSPRGAIFPDCNAPPGDGQIRDPADGPVLGLFVCHRGQLAAVFRAAPFPDDPLTLYHYIFSFGQVSRGLLRDQGHGLLRRGRLHRPGRGGGGRQGQAQSHHKENACQFPSHGLISFLFLIGRMLCYKSIVIIPYSTFICQQLFFPSVCFSLHFASFTARPGALARAAAVPTPRPPGPGGPAGWAGP